MKISACIITKNEEKNIARSILSYKDIVDEIIVVDSESTDDTVRIVEDLGATVYVRPWTNDFAAAKNYAIDKATGDWIIFLDADEYFDIGGAVRAAELLRMADKNNDIDALSIQMKHFADEQGNVLTVHPITRIFKNFEGIRYKSSVHEYLQKNGVQLNVLATDETLLIHTGYIRMTMPEKLERNLEILMELEITSDLKCDILLSKAECYSGLKRHKEVLASIEEIMADDNVDAFVKKSAKSPDMYKFKVGAMLAEENTFTDEEIEACIEEGMRRFSRHPEVTQLMVQYLYERGRQAEAIEYLEKALEQDKKYKGHYVNSFGGTRDKKYVALGDLYTFYKNDLMSARDCYEEAIKISKYNVSALSGYLWTIKNSEINMIIRNMDRFYDRNNSDDIRMILTAGLLCGMRDVFTTYFMYFAKSWPEKLGADKTLINKVNLMKRDYNSLLHVDAPFWFIGELAFGDVIRCEKWIELDDRRRKEVVLAAALELMQAGDEMMLARLLEAETLYNKSDIAKDMAKIFELQRSFEKAKEFYNYAGLKAEAKRMERLMKNYE